MTSTLPTGRAPSAGIFPCRIIWTVSVASTRLARVLSLRAALCLLHRRHTSLSILVVPHQGKPVSLLDCWPSCRLFMKIKIKNTNHTLKFISIYTHVIIIKPHSGWVDVIFQHIFQFILTLVFVIQTVTPGRPFAHLGKNTMATLWYLQEKCKFWLI